MKRLILLFLLLPSLCLGQASFRPTRTNQQFTLTGPTTLGAAGVDSSAVIDIRGFSNYTLLVRATAINASTTFINLGITLRFHTASAVTDSTTYLWYPGLVAASDTTVAGRLILAGANSPTSGEFHVVVANSNTSGAFAGTAAIPLGQIYGNLPVTSLISVKVRVLSYIGNATAAIFRTYLLASN